MEKDEEVIFEYSNLSSFYRQLFSKDFFSSLSLVNEKFEFYFEPETWLLNQENWKFTGDFSFLLYFCLKKDFNLILEEEKKDVVRQYVDNPAFEKTQIKISKSSLLIHSKLTQLSELEFLKKFERIQKIQSVEKSYLNLVKKMFIFMKEENYLLSCTN